MTAFGRMKTILLCCLGWFNQPVGVIFIVLITVIPLLLMLMQHYRRVCDPTDCGRQATINVRMSVPRSSLLARKFVPRGILRAAVQSCGTIRISSPSTAVNTVLPASQIQEPPFYFTKIGNLVNHWYVHRGLHSIEPPSNPPPARKHIDSILRVNWTDAATTRMFRPHWKRCVSNPTSTKCLHPLVANGGISKEAFISHSTKMSIILHQITGAVSDCSFTYSLEETLEWYMSEWKVWLRASSAEAHEETDYIMNVQAYWHGKMSYLSPKIQAQLVKSWNGFVLAFPTTDEAEALNEECLKQRNAVTEQVAKESSRCSPSASRASRRRRNYKKGIDASANRQSRMDAMQDMRKSKRRSLVQARRGVGTTIATLSSVTDIVSVASDDDDAVLDDVHAPDSSAAVDVTQVVPNVRVEETHAIDMEVETSYVSEDLQRQLLWQPRLQCKTGRSTHHHLFATRRLDTIIEEDDAAATILQAFDRSSALRAIFLEKTKASIVIQSIVRSRLSRRAFLKMIQSSVTLQSVVRSYLARRQLLQAAATAVPSSVTKPSVETITSSPSNDAQFVCDWEDLEDATHGMEKLQTIGKLKMGKEDPQQLDGLIMPRRSTRARRKPSYFVP